MLRLLSVTLLPLLIAGQEFQCGTDKIQSDIAKTVVQFNCKDKVADINKCCGAHDGCYDRQEPRGTCDATFCSCVQAASAGNPLCGFYTNLFCDTAKVFGEPAYKKVGEERKRREAAAAAAAALTSTTPPTAAPAAAPPTTTAAAPAVLVHKPEAKKAETAKVLKSATITKVAEPKVTVTKDMGESRHKEEKLPGEKPTTAAPEKDQTSSEEDRELADLEARLAREEADLERAEAEQQRVLAKLAERKAALREELKRFREAQRKLWKHKVDAVATEESEDSTLTPSTTLALAPATTTTVTPSTTVATTTHVIDQARAERRALRRLEMRARQQEMRRKIDEHHARVLAAKTLRLHPTTTSTTTVVPVPETVEPKVTVTSDLLEGSGQEETAASTAAVTAAGTWTDDGDLIPEKE